VIGLDDRYVAEFWRIDGGTDADLRTKVEEIASPPPQTLNAGDEAATRRWIAAAFTAALIAIDQLRDESEREQRIFAWNTARSLYDDPEMFPMDASYSAPV
jgi:hypothetical protein